MDIDWLQTFVVAADRQNFRAAAEVLHLAQPTVTLQIQKLEQQLGLKLFNRRGRNVVLSAAGQRFLPYARQVLQALDVGRSELLRWTQGYTETIRIGVSPLIATTMLPRWIQAYSAAHPGTEFSVLVRESNQILESVTRGEIDLGLSRMPFAYPRGSCTVLYADPIVFVAPVDEYDHDGPAPTPEELFVEYPVFTHNHPEYWDSLELTLRRAFPHVRTMKISQVHVTIDWVAERMGVSFLPASTVRRELLRGRVREIPFSAFTLPTAHTYLITPPRPAEGVRSFAEFVRAYMDNRVVT